MKQLFVYVGKRPSANATMCGLAPLDDIHDNVDLERCRWFKTRREIVKLAIGHIYEAETSDKGITLKFDRRGSYADQQAITEWFTLNDAAEVAERIAKREKSDRTRNLIDEAIEPIVRAYHATDATGKRAIEVLVLERLRLAKYR